MQQEIERELKTALLGGDREKVETLKSLKSALQYEAVALKVKPDELSQEQVQNVFAREAKKRQEALTLYESVGETDRAEKESREKHIIDHYLPEQLSEAEIVVMVDEQLSKLESPSMKDMGKVIGAVKANAGNSIDGRTLAKIVKDKLGQT